MMTIRTSKIKKASAIVGLSTVVLLTQCAPMTKAGKWAVDGILNGPPVTQTTTGDNYTVALKKSGNLNRVAAKVDQSVVTKNELDFMLSPIRKQLAAQFPKRNKQYYAEYSKAKSKIYQDLIDRELILNEFKSLGAQIPQRQVDYEIKNRIASLYNGKRSLFLADLKKNGLSQAKYRSLVERTMAVGAMKAEHFTTFAPPTTSELQKEYSKFSSKLRDISRDKASYKKIWIKRHTDELGSNEETQLELAEEIAQKIRKGASFSELAKEHSADIFAKDGGQWPMTARFDFPVHFAPIVFDAPVGKLIGPLADESGFHIIQVTKRIEGPSPPLSKVRPQLEQRVKAEKSAARFNRWITRLRNRASIQRFL